MPAVLRNSRHRFAAALFLGAAFSAGGAFGQVPWWQDPVVAHTNGMRLASSTPERSHNVYWRCDENHLGYCNGRMYGPLTNDLDSIGARPHGAIVIPAGPRPGPVSDEACATPTALETATSERIGTLSNLFAEEGSIARVPAARPAPPAAAPSNNGDWLSDLQALGEKIQSSAGISLP